MEVTEFALFSSDLGYTCAKEEKVNCFDVQTCLGASLFSPPDLHRGLSSGDSKHAGEGDKGFDCKPGLLASVLGFEMVCDIGHLVVPFSVIGIMSCFKQGPPLFLIVGLTDAACDGK